MQGSAGVTGRKDALRNRAALLEAAAAVFEEHGPTAPLGRIADRAGLSRASLARHFPGRQALIAAIWETDVQRIEATAAALAEDPDAFFRLLDCILRSQVDRRAVQPTAEQLGHADMIDLAARVRDAVGVALDVSRSACRVRPDLTVTDAMLAIEMCAHVITAPRERDERLARMRRLSQLLQPGLRGASVASDQTQHAPVDGGCDRITDQRSKM